MCFGDKNTEKGHKDSGGSCRVQGVGVNLKWGNWERLTEKATF